MRKKLTPKLIDNLPAPSARRYEVRDELVVGLLIRVSASGGKVWYAVCRIRGKARRIKIGTYPILSLADAREKARELLRDVQLGKLDEERREVLTFGEVTPQFIELYAKPRNRSWKSTERVLTKFSRLNHKPIDEIRRHHIVSILDEMTTIGITVGANRALAAVKKLFAWCVDRGTIEINPVAGLKAPAKEVSRDRVLADEELAAYWKSCNAEGFPFAQFGQILLLTGQRRGEVAGMCWSEIDFERRVWTIPAKRAKNATQHTVPLAPLVVELLKSIPHFLNSDLVFTTTGKTPISGFGRLKRRFTMGVSGDAWRLHDLRRTMATNMALAGIQPHIIEAVLNHKSGIVSGVAAIYNRHAYLDEKRDALDKWSTRVIELLKDAPCGFIVTTSRL
ncbi:MAG: tyrosine-type recombinase/integrase [Xanthobacteraceae bacterium]